MAPRNSAVCRYSAVLLPGAYDAGTTVEMGHNYSSACILYIYNICVRVLYIYWKGVTMDENGSNA